MGELRKEINEKLAKMIKEAMNSKRMQSIPKRKNHEQTTSRIDTSRIETSKCINDKDGGINAVDTDNQENEIQNDSFRPSGANERRTPIQQFSIPNIKLDDTVQEMNNEDRTREDYQKLCKLDPGNVSKNFPWKTKEFENLPGSSLF